MIACKNSSIVLYCLWELFSKLAHYCVLCHDFLKLLGFCYLVLFVNYLVFLTKSMVGSLSEFM